MRLIFSSTLMSVLVCFSLEASAQCWPPGRNLSAVELTACFMAEYQRCEEQVPGFKNQAAKGIDKFTNQPRYREIAKSKDFDRFRQEAYNNLAGQPVSSGCSSKLAYLKKGMF
ncbi:MAG: hypothetical protein Q8J80_08290 [Gallionella sp.]|nr:hypothetical protein [Gallionella sp.]